MREIFTARLIIKILLVTSFQLVYKSSFNPIKMITVGFKHLGSVSLSWQTSKGTKTFNSNIIHSFDKSTTLFEVMEYTIEHEILPLNVTPFLSRYQPWDCLSEILKDNRFAGGTTKINTTEGNHLDIWFGMAAGLVNICDWLYLAENKVNVYNLIEQSDIFNSIKIGAICDQKHIGYKRESNPIDLLDGSEVMMNNELYNVLVVNYVSHGEITTRGFNKHNYLKYVKNKKFDPINYRPVGQKLIEEIEKSKGLTVVKL